jgi:hypothetical protein
MSRKQADSAVGRPGTQSGRRYARRSIGLLAAVLLASIPAGTGARPAPDPSISVAIDVSTRDCRAVTVDYQIKWEGLDEDAAGLSFVELRVSPDSTDLASTFLDLGRKAGHWKGRIRDNLVRESGYFDWQTYPDRSYQVVVRYNNDEVIAVSDALSIPTCVPMSPVTGLAEGGTMVTIFGGGTFGGDGFTTATVIRLDGTTAVTPAQVADDGTWLTFQAPAGPAGTCVSVWTEQPGLPFSLPSFCYGA